MNRCRRRGNIPGRSSPIQNSKSESLCFLTVKLYVKIVIIFIYITLIHRNIVHAINRGWRFRQLNGGDKS